MVTACGIVCEYNPFHNGHKYQIDYIKKTYHLPVVCAMSGDFVQRATPALFDKRERARSAVNNGADIVLEIPFPYSSMSAERFARAGVNILTKCGMCSHIAFGSECADIQMLQSVADFLLSTDFFEALPLYREKHPNMAFAVIRRQITETYLGKTCGDCLSRPNDILAVEYLKAIRVTDSPLIPIAVKRQTADDDSFASSSDIRAMYLAGKREAAEKFMPCIPDGALVLRYENFERLLHTSLMVKTPAELKSIAEIAGGSEHLLVKKARESLSYDELCRALKCKSFTDAKIRRMLLFAFFGVTNERQGAEVAYTNILTARDTEQAKDLLRLCRRQKSIPVCRAPSAAKKRKDSALQYEFSENAERVLRACDAVKEGDNL